LLWAFCCKVRACSWVLHELETWLHGPQQRGSSYTKRKRQHTRYAAPHGQLHHPNMLNLCWEATKSPNQMILTKVMRKWPGVAMTTCATCMLTSRTMSRLRHGLIFSGSSTNANPSRLRRERMNDYITTLTTLSPSPLIDLCLATYYCKEPFSYSTPMVAMVYLFSYPKGRSHQGRRCTS